MLKGLELKNFKSFKQTSVRSLGRVNLILGHNGCGKSNLLTSVLFACSDSIRLGTA
jgi:AAA15 family ATPase/GTPase